MLLSLLAVRAVVRRDVLFDGAVVADPSSACAGEDETRPVSYDFDGFEPHFRAKRDALYAAITRRDAAEVQERVQGFAACRALDRAAWPDQGDKQRILALLDDAQFGFEALVLKGVVFVLPGLVERGRVFKPQASSPCRFNVGRWNQCRAGDIQPPQDVSKVLFGAACDAEALVAYHAASNANDKWWVQFAVTEAQKGLARARRDGASRPDPRAARSGAREASSDTSYAFGGGERTDPFGRRKPAPPAPERAKDAGQRKEAGVDTSYAKVGGRRVDLYGSPDVDTSYAKVGGRRVDIYAGPDVDTGYLLSHGEVTDIYAGPDVDTGYALYGQQIVAPATYVDVEQTFR